MRGKKVIEPYDHLNVCGNARYRVGKDSKESRPRRNSFSGRTTDVSGPTGNYSIQSERNRNGSYHDCCRCSRLPPRNLEIQTLVSTNFFSYFSCKVRVFTDILSRSRGQENSFSTTLLYPTIVPLSTLSVCTMQNPNSKKEQISEFFLPNQDQNQAIQSSNPGVV